MISYEPGSFRDPSGRVFGMDGRIFRTITNYGNQNFKDVVETGLIENLIAEGKLVSWREINARELWDEPPTEVKKVIEHEKISFISYPYEWSFAHLKSAAILFLEILIESLEKDVILIDGSAFNIQFDDGKPIFIDLLSFQPYVSGQYWIGHRQFCEHFFNPLVVSSKYGIPHNHWFRGDINGLSTKDSAAFLGALDWLSPKLLINILLPQYFENRILKTVSRSATQLQNKSGIQKAALVALVKRMKRWISALEYKPSSASAWTAYEKHNNYLDDEMVEKVRFVSEFVASVEPGVLWDLGCNTGFFSELALSKGAKKVIGFENDRDALELAARSALQKNLPFLPLHMDLANPSPSQGWNLTERASLTSRKNADGVLALAFIHHLVFRNNILLDEAVHSITGTAPHGVLEFVPKDDQMAKNLIGDREDMFPDYTFENILDLIKISKKIVATKKITGSGRTLIWFGPMD
jgi:ribosomal protein L11 methylase PrmA